MIIAKRINIYRNILPYKFVHKETASNLKEIEEKVIDHLIKYDFTVSSREINKKQFKLLKHKFSDIEIIINYINHLTITVSDFSDDDLYQLYLKAVEVEKKVKDSFNLAFSNKFGYLMPFLRYVPHGWECEIVFSLFFCDKYNQKNSIVKNIEMAGHEVEYNFLPLDYIIKMKTAPAQNQSLDDFINRLSSFVRTIEREEENKFNNYLLENEVIFLDLVKKLEGYTLSSTVLNYRETLEILINMLYFFKFNRLLEKIEKIKKSILLVKRIDSISEMKKNSRRLISILRD